MVCMHDHVLVAAIYIYDCQPLSLMVHSCTSYMQHQIINIDDPCGNSFVESTETPFVDPQLTLEHYMRTQEQDLQLGLQPVCVHVCVWCVCVGPQMYPLVFLLVQTTCPPSSSPITSFSYVESYCQ